MCLILFAYDCHPRYQLVVAANRDEFYERTALPASFWPDNLDILAGKDLKQGGTWMGVTTTGRFAGLTNYRDPSTYNTDAPSRGYLVQDYLTGQLHPESYIANLPDQGAAYNGFNLLMGTPDSLYCFSNREKQLRKVEKGVHGLSNSLLDVPWPKVSKGIKSLADCLQQVDIEAESLFRIMADQEQPLDQDLPQTGVSLEAERMLAPAFVVSPKYGTKTSTVILIERNHRIRFWERSFIPGQVDKFSEVYYEFEVS